MISVNGEKIELGHFPDGTMLLNVKPCKYGPANIMWKYEDDKEMVALLYITSHIRENSCADMNLILPYIPNARQDRVKNETDVFTLKYFADLINYIYFDHVIVFDPHSSVSCALLDRLVVVTPESIINSVFQNVSRIERKPPLVFYPDEGSMKRYSGMLTAPYAFGVKKRNWETGKIQSLDVIGDADTINGSNVLIIDDICSKGGTFYHSALKLKEMSANHIYLYVSHCENTIFDGKLLNSGLIERIYTTNSLFTHSHDLIEVIDIKEILNEH